MSRAVVRPVLVACLGSVFMTLFTPVPASAAVKDVRSGNYYFEDPATGSRSEIRAVVGDQLRVTHAGPGRHTVDVDELGIHSPMFTDGQTFTTPPLDQPGTYRFYCDPHEGRGHVTTLVVVDPDAGSSPAPSASPTPTPSPTPSPSASATPSSSPPTASPDPSPRAQATSPATAPDDPDAVTASPGSEGAPSESPVGGASDGSIPSDGDGAPEPAGDTPSGGAAADAGDSPSPGSDETSTSGEVVASGISGGAGEPAPWTRGVWLGLLALLPMLGAAAWSLRGDRPG